MDLCKFFEEKGFDRKKNLVFDTDGFVHILPLGVVFDAIDEAPAEEQEKIARVLRIMDFHNAPSDAYMEFFTYLAKVVI
ncbi:MAG: hypothetical protein D6698_15445 [Gammaproteobacteria bacterium]|nr:MAG: hypothetical protein D6698_15445 [Gammaproteobacteria bacterium]